MCLLLRHPRSFHRATTPRKSPWEYGELLLSTIKTDVGKQAAIIYFRALQLRHRDCRRKLDQDTMLRLSLEMVKRRAQRNHIKMQREPEPADMCCLGTPKHLARNATSYPLNSRDERSLSVVHSRVLQRNGLSIRRNDRPEIQHHTASTPSIRS